MLIYINNEDLRTEALCRNFIENGDIVFTDINKAYLCDICYLGIKGDSCGDIQFKEGSRVYILVENHSIKKQCIQDNAHYIVLYNDKELVRKNAILTSEALLSYMIEHSVISIANSNVLVMGYGVCGKDISLKLKKLDANVTVSNRMNHYKDAVLDEGFVYCCSDDLNLCSYDFIVNTVPCNVFNTQLLTSLKSSCLFFDIASSPYGLSEENRFENYTILPGLPSKYAYRSAAKLLFKTIDKKEREYV